MGPVLGNAPSRAGATLRPNGRQTEKESLLITPVRASATFSLSTHRKSKRRMRTMSPLTYFLISVRTAQLRGHRGSSIAAFKSAAAFRLRFEFQQPASQKVSAEMHHPDVA